MPITPKQQVLYQYAYDSVNKPLYRFVYKYPNLLLALYCSNKLHANFTYRTDPTLVPYCHITQL